MTADGQNRVSGALTREMTGIAKNWGWFLVLGMIQIIAGTIAVGFGCNTTFSSAVILGVVLLIAGGVQITAAYLALEWDGFYLFLLLGIVYGVAGCLMFQRPLIAANGLPDSLGALFFLVGLFRIAVALVDHLLLRGWVLFNGVVTAALGLAIWRQSPESGLWALGMLVGIELIVNGATWAAMAVGTRHRLAPLIDR